MTTIDGIGLRMKYFVLSPTSSDDDHAAASREAILTYAACMDGINPQLAHDLRNWVEHLDLNDDREGK